jgi:hypothetical protein
MKATTIGKYGFMVDKQQSWNNYARGYTGYKLVKGQDEKKEIEFTKNEAGFVNGVFIEGENNVSESVNTKGVMLVKVITASDHQIFEDELNIFNQNHNVKYTQTMVYGNSLVAVVYFED